MNRNCSSTASIPAKSGYYSESIAAILRRASAVFCQKTSTMSVYGELDPQRLDECNEKQHSTGERETNAARLLANRTGMVNPPPIRAGQPEAKQHAPAL